MTIASPIAAADDLPRGTWPLPRHDAGNTARADVPGRMTEAPREVWRWGEGSRPSSFVHPIDGGEKWLVQVRRGLELLAADGKPIWSRPTLGVSSVIAVADFAGDGKLEALVGLGVNRLALIDTASGETLWQWTLPDPGRIYQVKVLPQKAGAWVVVFPVNTSLGICWDFTVSLRRPRLAWQKDYAGKFLINFGPAVMTADMNNDGRAEIVIASKHPSDQPYAAVINADTGDVMFDGTVAIAGGETGRPYGVLHAIDLDGDGFRDLVIASNGVEEYIAVFRNDGGKAFTPAWSRFIEKDWPEDHKALRPTTTSAANLRGDGKRQFVISLFNDTGDNRWHTLVLDAMSGATQVDQPDQYLWGCFDLDGDGRDEVVTSEERARAVQPASTLAAWKLDGQRLSLVSKLENAVVEARGLGLLTPLPDEIAIGNTINVPLWVRRRGDAGGIIVRQDGKRGWWSLAEKGGRVEPFNASPTAWNMLLSQRSPRWEKLDLRLPPLDEDRGPLAAMPLVSAAGARRELCFALSDGTIVGGEVDLKDPEAGKFNSSWKVEGVGPSIWQGAGGARALCAFSADGRQLLLYSFESNAVAPAEPRRVKLPLPAHFYPPASRTADSTIHLINNIIPFGGERMRVFVPLRASPATYACALFDDRGELLWLDDKHGPYPRPAGVFEGGASGETVVVDDHGKHVIYDVKGQPRVVAQGWGDELPGRSDGAKYALPMTGPFGEGGAERIIMASGLDALEVLDRTGVRLARHKFASTYIYGITRSAAAKLGADGPWVCGLYSSDGVFACHDLATAAPRWVLDLGVPTSATVSIVAGDIDGDGRDNFLIGLPNGQLVALDERDGKGVVLWKVDLHAAMLEILMADVDGDGVAEIVVETDDGVIHVLAGK